jgi:hypothetical protein
MNKITINEQQCAELNGFDAANEVRDGTGRLIGYLISPAKYAEFLEAKEEADIAELDRRAQDTDVGTLDELWKEIGIE